MCECVQSAESRIGRLRDGNPDIEGDSEVQPTPMFFYSTESIESTSVQIVLSSKRSTTVNIWLNFTILSYYSGNWNFEWLSFQYNRTMASVWSVCSKFYFLHNIKIFNHILKILPATLDIELKNCPSGLGSVDQTKSLSDGGLRFRERRGRVKGLDSKPRIWG